jgi:hypothetical protein
VTGADPAASFGLDETTATLFGVVFPPNAVRAVVRPVFPGRGPTLPLYDERIEGGALPTDTEVIVSASRNADFWEYVESAIQAGRIQRAERWSWKLRIQFQHQDGALSNPVVTQEAFEFYRAQGAGGGRGGSTVEERLIALAERLVGAVSAVQVACISSVKEGIAAVTDHAGKAMSAMASAHAEAIKGSSQAHGQAIQGVSQALGQVATQQQQLADISKELLKETQDLKETCITLTAKSAQAQKPPETPRTIMDDLKDAKTLIDGVKSFGNALFPEDDTPAKGGSGKGGGGAAPAPTPAPP